MDIIFGPLITVLLVAIRCYMWIVILSAVLSWLVHFNVVNASNQLVYTLLNITWRLTEPPLRPIRRFLPAISGVDLSPMVLILGLIFLENLIVRLAISFAVH